MRPGRRAMRPAPPRTRAIGRGSMSPQDTDVRAPLEFLAGRAREEKLRMTRVQKVLTDQRDLEARGRAPSDAGVELRVGRDDGMREPADRAEDPVHFEPA